MNKDFILLFKIKDNPTFQTIVEEIDLKEIDEKNEKKIHKYALMTVVRPDNFKDVDVINSEFIFVVDCSESGE
jgi:hypothetical protein